MPRDIHNIFNLPPKRKRHTGRMVAGGFIAGAMLGLAILLLSPWFLGIRDTMPHTIMKEVAAVKETACLTVSVHDGDTFHCDGTKVRLVAASGPVDAPEFASSRRCEPGRDGWCDEALAEQSRDRLDELLSGRSMQLDCTGADRYGRALCRAAVDGRDVGDALVADGLARIEERWR